MNKHFIEEDIPIAKKHLTRCSSLVTGEMQVKTAMRYFYTPTRMTHTNNNKNQPDNIKCW